MSSRLRTYEIVPVNAEDIEDSIRDQKLVALHRQGYRLAVAMPVEHRGRPTLAMIMEPPPEEQPEQPIPSIQAASPWAKLKEPIVLVVLLGTLANLAISLLG